MNKIAATFSDNFGNLSSLRVVMAGTIVIVLGTWSYVSMATLQVQPIGTDLLGVISAILGAKIWQKSIEQQNKGGSP